MSMLFPHDYSDSIRAKGNRAKQGGAARRIEAQIPERNQRVFCG